MKYAKNHICPRCGGGVPNDMTPGLYIGALSRWDNDTEICSECGVAEAMLDFAHGEYREGGAHLDPNNPDHPWWITKEVAIKR